MRPINCAGFSLYIMLWWASGSYHPQAGDNSSKIRVSTGSSTLSSSQTPQGLETQIMFSIFSPLRCSLSRLRQTLREKLSLWLMALDLVVLPASWLWVGPGGRCRSLKRLQLLRLRPGASTTSQSASPLLWTHQAPSGSRPHRRSARKRDMKY